MLWWSIFFFINSIFFCSVTFITLCVLTVILLQIGKHLVQCGDDLHLAPLVRGWGLVRGPGGDGFPGHMLHMQLDCLILINRQHLATLAMYHKLKSAQNFNKCSTHKILGWRFSFTSHGEGFVINRARVYILDYRTNMNIKFEEGLGIF